jgi:hypothetical protein
MIGGWTFLDPESDGEDARGDETEDEEDEVTIEIVLFM